MPSSSFIRPTIEADLPAIEAIYAEAVASGTGSFELESPGTAVMTNRWRKRVSKGYPHIVSVADGSVVGFAYASRFRASAAFNLLIEDSIYVATRAQRCGVGRALLTHLIATCEGLEFTQMMALIAHENASSVRLHERLGFRKVGLIEGSAFKHGRWIDTLVMQRSLENEGRS